MLGLLRHSIWGHLKTHIVAYFFLILIFMIGVVAGAFAVKTLPDEQKTELIGYLRLFFQIWACITALVSIVLSVAEMDQPFARPKSSWNTVEVSLSLLKNRRI